MIYILIGGVGSGKSISMTREISMRKNICFANFKVKYRNWRHISEKDMIIPERSNTGKITGYEVNWSFFEDAKKKYGKYDIFIDELHDLLNSRRSVSNKNICLSQWLSQVRKILGNTKENHLYTATQTLKRVDVNIRDLCHFVVEHTGIEIPMEKLKGKKEYDKRWKTALIVKRTTYGSGKANDGVDSYLMNNNIIARDWFLGNPYFDRYDSFEIINR